MSEPSRQIVRVLLRVVADPGHGGPVSEYRIEPVEDGFEVTLRISLLTSGPEGGRPAPPTPPSPTPRTLPPPRVGDPAPSHHTEVLSKDRRQVEAFLEKLSAEFRVYELASLEPRHPFLHPTFYSFSFRDAAGGSHDFVYRIECSNHLDDRYRALVQEFDHFFESVRVFASFFAGRRRNA